MTKDDFARYTLTHAVRIIAHDVTRMIPHVDEQGSRIHKHLYVNQEAALREMPWLKEVGTPFDRGKVDLKIGWYQQQCGCSRVERVTLVVDWRVGSIDAIFIPKDSTVYKPSICEYHLVEEIDKLSS